MGANDSKEFWHKDTDFTHCEGCKETFSMTNRRHHCRCCGRVFCNECTSSRGCPINPQTNKPATTEPVRLCSLCATSAISKKSCSCRTNGQQNGNKNNNNTNGQNVNGDNNNDNGNGRKVSSLSKRNSILNGGGGVDDDLMNDGKQNGMSARNARGESNLDDANNNNNQNNNNGGEGYYDENGEFHHHHHHHHVNSGGGMTAQEREMKFRLDEITKEMNDNIINLSPFTSDYGLHFSDAPVYGMRIATVLGPLAFNLPNPDAGNSENVAALLCSEAADVPQALLFITNHALRDFDNSQQQQQQQAVTVC